MKNNIKFLRKQLGLRQEDVANTLNVTRQTINAIENNKYNPTLELAMKLAKLLDTTVDKLFTLCD
ncbi:MAG: helix-turn-helix transcriptional regulator [Clostridium tyrobutyricum]|jgi:putative transcriptional regulator|uniref:helix-turn-helix transcriptional regulator n=1 Tax=Clostridium tyrobutyricum TaxID=1519 RepID=UPI00242AD364|nr:helix-turn-helix transcriptional regulator [Clostridium tyrobutyricum]MCH4201172.1 helix-turn-helix transcriptional regulator [Clostridium tyrobutyricum]MCH4260347.1 helix-turn-helix transcriptional regulator [Clostridium tyrobutyricum]